MKIPRLPFAQKHSGIQIGLIASLAAIALSFIMTGIFLPFGTTECRPDPVSSAQVICDQPNLIAVIIQFVAGVLGFMLAPLWLGVLYALIWATQSRWTFWKTFGQLIISSCTMLASFIIFEILLYRPWDSTPYNRFELNRIYTTSFGVLVLFGAVFGFLMTIVFTKRLWRSFEPMGFLPSKKQSK